MPILRFISVIITCFEGKEKAGLFGPAGALCLFVRKTSMVCIFVEIHVGFLVFSPREIDNFDAAAATIFSANLDDVVERAEGGNDRDEFIIYDVVNDGFIS